MAEPDATSEVTAGPAASERRRWGGLLETILDNPAVFMAGILLAMWLVLSRLSPYFFTLDNLLEITVQAAVIALLAVGQTFVILSAGIDLSVGAVLAASSVVATLLMDRGFGLTAGLAGGLLCGATFGAANGVAVGMLGIPPFIATLGMMGIARGAALIISGGIPLFNLAPGFEVLGQGRVAGIIPVPTLTTLGLYALGYLILSRTRLGRYTYSIGSNLQATLFSGVNVPRYLVLIYTVSGLTAAVAGLTEASRIGSGQPAGGVGYELEFDRRGRHRRHQPVRRRGQSVRLPGGRPDHRHPAQRPERARGLRVLATGRDRCHPDRRRLSGPLAATTTGRVTGGGSTNHEPGSGSGSRPDPSSSGGPSR